jgi:glycosyltransferase involved in cell wall biosynthesis
MQRDLIVSVVIPTCNSVQLLLPFVQAVNRSLKKTYHHYEIIVVDDGSKDHTADAVRALSKRDFRLRLLVLSRRYGREIALTAGIDHSIGDFVIVLPSIVASPELLIRQLLDRAAEGHDLVFARCLHDASPRFLHVARQRLKRQYFRFLSSMTGLKIDPDVVDIALLSRRLVNSIMKLKEQNRYVRMLIAYVGFEASYVDLATHPGSRLHEASTLRSSTRLAFELTTAFSNRPLRYVSIAAFSISAISLIAAVAVFLERLTRTDLAEGWASLMVVQLFMFCLLFLLMSIISEYVGKILDESKNRPLYYVKENLGGTTFDIDNIVDVT